MARMVFRKRTQEIRPAPQSDLPTSLGTLVAPAVSVLVTSVHGDGDRASCYGLLQGTHKPNAPRKPLPAVPLNKTSRLAHTSARSLGQQESGLHLAPIRWVDRDTHVSYPQTVWGLLFRPRQDRERQSRPCFPHSTHLGAARKITRRPS